MFLFLFRCFLFFFTTFVVSSSTLIRNVVEGPVGCPLEGHMTCNSHNMAQKCLCYVSEYATYTNIYPLCYDLNSPFVRYFVMEFKVDITSSNWVGYTWPEFDIEMAFVIEDVLRIPSKNVVFLRKKCIGHKTVMLQFAVLKNRAAFPLNSTFSHYEKAFEQIRVAVHSLATYMATHKNRYGVTDVRESIHIVPLNRMMNPGMGNFCEKNALSIPVICNAHRTDRQCVCQTTHQQSYYGNNIIDCDRLLNMDTTFQTEFWKFSTIVFRETILTPNPQVFDAVLVSELETIMKLPEGSIFIIRKYCKNQMLYVQFLEFENPNTHPPFTKEDFAYGSYKAANIEQFRNKFEIGVLAKKQSTRPSTLPPIVKGLPNEIPFDATFLVKLMHILFVGVTYRHYVACFLPVIIATCIIYSIKLRLDKEEAEFEKAYPRIKRSSISSSSFKESKQHMEESLLTGSDDQR